ncbi:response regulator transcription factor [Vibrio maerlii]|uniref:response regulator transcription factor n=1 Tax=Vibrio maerlii TaxID=2231648 RepID=UPI0013E0637A|nr:response regulator transcription factor [Vibrio maerlii]
MQTKILIVDDKLSVQQLLVDFLTTQGFEVECASNGLEAIQKLKQFQPNLILLDIMMPLMDGYKFIQKLRETNETPVIVISAKQQEEDIVAGFEMGADDYIVKPFRMMELLVRVKAVLKRSHKDFSVSNKFEYGPLIVNTHTKEFYLSNQVIDVTKAEHALLTMLVKSRSHAVPKAEISCNLIEQGFSGAESTMKIHIRNLRNKLAPISQGQVEIESVFGVGYRLKVS